MKRSILWMAVFTLQCSIAVAEPVTSPVNAEVTQLLNKLEASGCKFNRNGNWHSSSEAKSHLLKKLSYLERKTTLSSAEQFIELAATKSSLSGNPYLVKCGTTDAVQSSVWLTAELKGIRANQHE